MVTELGQEYGRWSSPRGSVATWVLPPGVLVTRAEGHLDVELAQRITRSGNVVIAQFGGLTAFHDWQRIATYDSKARSLLTTWGYDIRKDVRRVHILVGSKLVKMGVSVASLVLVGMIVAYDDRASFERALGKAIAR